MSNTDASVAEQDALSNAFLAVFGILLLLLVQVGLEDTQSRIEEQIYGAVPDFDPLWSGGTGQLAVWPRGDVAIISAPTTVRVRDQVLPAQTHPPVLDCTVGTTAGSDAKLCVIDRGNGPLDERLVSITNTGPSPADITVALDAAAVGTPGVGSLTLQPGASIFLRLCARGAAYVATVPTGRCP